MNGGKSAIRKNEVKHTLACIATYQETLNQIAHRDMPVKKVCDISLNCIDSIGVIMTEFNDVITALENEEGLEDRVYRAAFCKALEIVMRASKYTRGNR